MSSAWTIGVAVFLGGAVGGALRHLLSTLAANAVGTRWPWGTLAVNVSGAFVAGFVVATGALPPGVVVPALLVTGVLGGYTTVSSVALQTVHLAVAAGRAHAAGYLATTLVLGAIAAMVGLHLGDA